MFQRKNFENRLRFDRNIMVMNLVCTFLAHPLDLAGCIMFSGCSSVCACVRAFMPGGGLLPPACRQRLFYSFDIFVIFTARCYASAVPAMGLCPCLCLSVCLSVCLSQAGVLLKRQNVGSHKQHHTIVQGL